MYIIDGTYLYRFCEEKEIEMLRENYGKKEFISYNDNENQVWMLMTYANRGLNVAINAIPDESNKQKNCPLYRMDIHVFFSQLLESGANSEILTASKEKIEEACKKLKEFVDLIETKSGVNIMKNTHLCQVDLAKILFPPTDLHSYEIIAALNKSIVMNEYYPYNPKTHNNTKYVVWTRGETIVFQDEDQQLEGIVYNNRNLLLKKYRDALNGFADKDMLCFELSLSRQQLKENYDKEEIMNSEQLAKVLSDVTNEPARLFDIHFSQVFFTGSLLSREIMKELIKDKFPLKNKRKKKMMAFSDLVSGKKAKKVRRTFTDAQIAKRREWFEEIGISPVSVCRECPYIPSISDLLNDRVNYELLDFAEVMTTFLNWF